jgi:hypothetical protein
MHAKTIDRLYVSIMITLYQKIMQRKVVMLRPLSRWRVALSLHPKKTSSKENLVTYIFRENQAAAD